MRYEKFEIRNFKGIRHVVLDLGKTPHSRIHTFVGLNESGKTTILEALNFFTYGSEALDPQDVAGIEESDVHSLIPIGEMANFNDKVSIKATLSMDDADNKALADFLKKEHGATVTEPITDFAVTEEHHFNASRF